MAVSMTRSSTAAALVAMTIISVLSPTLSVPLNATGGILSANFYANSCPQLEGIVRTEMYWALRGDIKLAAGLIRILFHDCFPQGCEASILLEGWNTEQNMIPNQTLQKRALLLIDQIRFKVQQACGAGVVSCADILALATRDAVIGAGGMSYQVALGRLDSFGPASAQDVNSLPKPTDLSSQLLSSFASRGFWHPMELVALSSAHSIGRAGCNSFSDRTARQEDPWARILGMVCARNPNWQQPLDHRTPDLLDNQYYVDLVARQGVFTSDMALMNDWRTANIVHQFANNPAAFQVAFSNAMAKLSNYMPRGNFGERRMFTCTRTNSGRVTQPASDEGLAASA